MACPKIRELRVRAVRVPMAQPHKTASGTISESPLILTDIVADDGTIGHSMIFTYAVAALKPTADLIKNLEPIVKGELLAPIELADKFAKRFRLLGLQGLVAMAVSAIDMALWDALARSHNTSLVRLLGYATVEEDLAVVRAMRKAVGNEMAIMVDYNQSLTPTEAVRRLRVLDEEGLTWVEEPVLAHDYQGHALVAREIKTPIQCGENWWGSHDMRQAVEARASDYMMPDVMKIGGVTGWMRAAALGEAYGIPLSNHLWPEISAQLMCATPTAHFLEYANWWNPVLAEPLHIEQGMAIVEGVTGTGVAWNEKAVEQFVI
jgi:mandelate racemase